MRFLNNQIGPEKQRAFYIAAGITPAPCSPKNLLAGACRFIFEGEI